MFSAAKVLAVIVYASRSFVKVCCKSVGSYIKRHGSGGFDRRQLSRSTEFKREQTSDSVLRDDGSALQVS